MPTMNSVHKAAEILGAIGGKKGGPARAKSLSAAERRSIAKAGGVARARHGRGKGTDRRGKRNQSVPFSE